MLTKPNRSSPLLKSDIHVTQLQRYDAVTLKPRGNGSEYNRCNGRVQVLIKQAVSAYGRPKNKTAKHAAIPWNDTPSRREGLDFFWTF